mgnify:CR=1 FL=1
MTRRRRLWAVRTATLGAVFACNAFVDAQAPWALRKNDPPRMAEVLGAKLNARQSAMLHLALSYFTWRALVRDFYREFRAGTPLFPELPREFIQYLQERGDGRGDPPWLLELAHYEWVELALSVAPALDERLADPRSEPGRHLAERRQNVFFPRRLGLLL